MDAVHKRCDIQDPAFWQTLHILSVTETNGLGSETTTIHLRLYKLRKILLIHRNIRLLGHFQGNGDSHESFIKCLHVLTSFFCLVALRGSV